MRLRPALALLPCLITVLAQAGPNEVSVRGTADGAIIRIPDAQLADCRLISSEPPRIVLAIDGANLVSRMIPNQSTWLRSVRAIGSDVLPGSESRIIVDVPSSWLHARVEAAGKGVALVISGANRPPGESTEAPVETRNEPASTDEPEAPTRQASPPRDIQSRTRQAPPPREAQPPPGRAAQPWANDVPNMVTVPGGEFVMGSLEGTSFADESPEHLVRLRAFRIDTHEVTVEQFSRSPLTMPRQPEWSRDGSNPVVNVTWHQAAEYCDWEGKRLPTESEWEMAARGQDRRTHPWGVDWSVAAANSGLDGDGFAHLAPVGSLARGASAVGAQDLAGNAWEWTADWYAKDAYEHSRSHGSAGPARGSHKVARGGSFRSTSSSTVTTTVRLPLPPSTRRDDVGFRCASSE
jgi:formylglycine-generating enzyme required for sulfatase activity